MTRKPTPKGGSKRPAKAKAKAKPAAKKPANARAKAPVRKKAKPPAKPKTKAPAKPKAKAAKAPKGKGASRPPEAYWLDEPRNVTKVVWTLVAVCALLFVADAFYVKHPYFAAEEWFGYYGVFGFVMCVALVLGAKWMRTILMRDEDYYDRNP